MNFEPVARHAPMVALMTCLGLCLLVVICGSVVVFVARMTKSEVKDAAQALSIVVGTAHGRRPPIAGAPDRLSLPRPRDARRGAPSGVRDATRNARSASESPGCTSPQNAEPGQESSA